MQLVRDRDEAQSLTQDTFVAAYRYFDTLKGVSAKPWLAKIAANKCKDYLKSAYKTKVVLGEESTLQAVDHSQNTPQLVESDAAVEEIFSCITMLPPAYRDIAILHFEMGLTPSQIGQKLHLPPGTVYTRIARAREKLQVLLKGAHHEHF